MYVIVFCYSLGEISLIRLRNPWGKDEWKGAWSDSSNEWKYLPDDVKNDKIDGEFFIALDDFLRVSNHTIIVIVKLIRYIRKYLRSSISAYQN